MACARPSSPFIRIAGAAFAALAMSAACLPATQAKERPPLTEEQRARFAEQLEEIRTRLDLSEEQRAQLEPILRENFEQRAEILQRYGVGKDKSERLGFRKGRALKKELEDARSAHEAKIATILDQRQMVEYRAIQAEMRDKIRERARERRS